LLPIDKGLTIAIMNPSTDNSIPLLTEVIAAATAEPTSPMPAVAAPPATSAAPIAAAISSSGTATAEQLRQIRQDIQEGVMQEMLKQVDNILHQHLQDHLAVVLDNIAEILKTRVRASLEKALAESVTQALAEEMARFENAKK
jgi:predicted lipid-binding transport protein (Tim44 family)